MNGRITLDEFMECYSRSSSDPQRIVEAAVDVVDCPELSNAAQRYLDAKVRYENVLDKIGFEKG